MINNLYLRLNKMVAYCCIYLITKFYLYLNHQILQDLYKENALDIYWVVIAMELYSLPLLMVGLRAKNNQHYVKMCCFGMIAFLSSLIAQYYNIYILMYVGIVGFIFEAKYMYYVIKTDC